MMKKLVVASWLILVVAFVLSPDPGAAATCRTPPWIRVPAADADGAYTVRWGASATPGVRYALEEATNSGFTRGRRLVATLGGVSKAITGRRRGAKYYYRVRAIKSGYAASAWRTGANGCAVPGTRAATPVSITVPATDADGAYTVSWGPSATPGASYVLEEARDAAFTSGRRLVATVSGFSKAISGRSQGVTYYYRVQVIRAGYRDSAWKAGANGCIVRKTGGLLDATFGTGGKVMTDIGSGDNYAYALGIQTDGKIVVAGDSSGGVALARYNVNGSLDSSFGTGGIVQTVVERGNDTAWGLAIQPNGKILVVVNSAIGGIYQFAVVRYNENGTLDTTFGTGGKAKTQVGSDDCARAIGIQSNGKIVVAGFTSLNGNYDMVIIRYNADGSLDTTFGPGPTTTGIVLVNTGTGDDYAWALRIQPDDKIVVAGRSSSNDFAIIRLTVDGSLDTTFGPDGGVVTPIGTGQDYAYALALQPNGRIVAAGNSVWNNTLDNFAVVRYLADGTPDSTFGTGGIVTTEIVNASAWGVGVQSDGKIVAVGRTSGTYYDFAVVRYNADGTPDGTFGSGGTVITGVGNYGDHAYAVGFQTDGKIVVAGDALSDAPNVDFAVVRYQP